MKNFVLKKNLLTQGKWNCGGNHSCFVTQLAQSEGFKFSGDYSGSCPVSYLEDEIGLKSDKLWKLVEINDNEDSDGNKGIYKTFTDKVKAWRPIMKELGYRLVVK